MTLSMVEILFVLLMEGVREGADERNLEIWGRNRGELDGGVIWLLLDAMVNKTPLLLILLSSEMGWKYRGARWAGVISHLRV